MGDHNRKAQLSIALHEMCQDSLYPPSCEMLYARVQNAFSDLNWSDNNFKRFIKDRLELFYGSGKIISKSLEEAFKRGVPYSIVRLIIDLRGKDKVYIEHRDCERAALHLQTVCDGAGFETVVRALKKDVGYGPEAILKGAMSTDLLKRLVVGYEYINFKEEFNNLNINLRPLYIAISSKVDIKMAWQILTGEIPSNANAVEKNLELIEKKVDQICQQLEESGDIEVELVAPVSLKIFAKMTEVMQKMIKSPPPVQASDGIDKTFERPRTKEHRSLLSSKYAKHFASELALAVFESKGFTFRLMPVSQHKLLLGLSLYKANTIFAEKPFKIQLSVGPLPIDPPISQLSETLKGFWVSILEQSRRLMAWKIYDTRSSERTQHKMPKNYVSIADQRRAMKACLMAQRSKNQHYADNEDADRKNFLDSQRANENVEEDEEKYP